MLEKTLDLSKYPAPKDIPKEQFVEVAERFFEKGDYGAALYYAGFAGMVGKISSEAIKSWFDQERIEWGDYDRLMGEYGAYLERTVEIINNSWNAINLELEPIALSARGVTLTPENEEALLEEFSPHYGLLQELQKKYGTRYSFNMPIVNKGNQKPIIWIMQYP